MSEMVERVAEALLQAQMRRLSAEDLARVAIEAMREPTAEMVDAAWNRDTEDLWPRPRAAWLAMIDEALK